MAKNGVCYLGNLNKYKKSVKEQIQTGNDGLFNAEDKEPGFYFL